MKALTFYQMLGEVDEEMVAEARPERKRRRRFRALPLMAAVLALLLMGAAEAVTGSISNLFAPLYGSSRTEVIDDIGRPVNASATADGYTITAEAVVGDRHTFAIVYTLTRDDGEPIPEAIRFDGWSNTLIIGSGSGYFGVEEVEGLPANQKRLMEQWDLELPILWRHAHITFYGLRELVENGRPGDGPLLAEGPWELDFSLRYKDATRNVPIPKNLVVTDENGREYAIKKVQLSPFSVHVDLTTANPTAGYTWEEYEAAGRPNEDQTRLPDFTIELKMKEGFEAPWIGKNVGSHSTNGEPTQNSNINGTFDVPVLPDEVEAVVLCGTEVPID